MVCATMKIEKLSNLCDIVIGRTPARKERKYWGKGSKWVSISDLKSKIIYETKEEITDYAIENIRCRKIPKGTLLFSFKLTIGKMAFAGCDLYTNEAIAALVIKDSGLLNSHFLFFALQVVKLVGSNQAAMGKTLNSKSLAELKIPIPPLDDQIRIVHLLSKVEGLIAQRQQNLQQLDDLLKSVFLEMFGPTNPSFEEWSLVEIKELAAKHKRAMRTGPFGSNLLHSEFLPVGDVAVLGIDNAVQNRFAWGKRRFITHKKYKELENYRIFPGDVIITIMGTIGRSAVIPNDIPIAINTKHLAAITLDRKVANPIFLSYSIHSSPYILNQFKRKTRGAIMSGLNLTLIKETKLRRPPIELQERFASIHAQVDNIKFYYQQSLTDLENLYGALSQKAFKGELDLSQIVVPTEQKETSEDMKPVEPVVPEKDTKPTIVLPAPVNLDSLNSTEGRKLIINQWLDSYLEQLEGIPFSAEHFMATAQERVWELIEDDAPELGTAAYDQLKKWLFLALESGRLVQAYDDTGNRVEILPAKG